MKYNDFDLVNKKKAVLMKFNDMAPVDSQKFENLSLSKPRNIKSRFNRAAGAAYRNSQSRNTLNNLTGSMATPEIDR